MLRLLAFVLPLGVDSFAVAAALGAAGLTSARERLRVSLIFIVFEAGMPLVGVAAGSGLARAIGSVADYLAGAAVIGLGTFMLSAGGDAEERLAGRVTASHGMAILGLGVSISVDELAIGFSLGLVRLPVVPVIVAIAVLALLASQLGLALGARVSGRFREAAERLAAVALILLGAYLIAEHAIAG
jgi:manganese efflux pump family protein